MKISTRQLALCAVLTALALGLSTLENLFPVTLVIPPAGGEAGPGQHRHGVRPVSAGRFRPCASWRPGACWAVSLPEVPRLCCFPCWGERWLCW